MTSPSRYEFPQLPPASARAARRVAAGIALVAALAPASVRAQVVEPRADGYFQEQVGASIQALGRYDLQRTTALHGQWSEVMETALAFDAGRDGRLQETLGQSIAAAARALEADRAALAAALAESLATQRRVRSGAWYQEQLGKGIVQAAGAVPPNDPRFGERLRSTVKVLSAMERRVGRQVDARLAALRAREDEFPRRALARLAASVADGYRVAHWYDTSHEAGAAQALTDIRNGLGLSRGAEDYHRLADAVSASLGSRWGVGGFWEFGAASLLGIIVAMVWVGATAPRDVPGSGRRAKSTVRTPLPSQWRREVAMAQSTTLFSWPREVIFGGECSRDIGRYAARDRVKQAMVLTDPGVVEKGLLEPVKASLAGSGVGCEVIDQVPREVPHTAVAEIAARCRQARTELLVAVGGGSVIDAAKAVGILLTNGGAIQDYEGIDRVNRAITLLYVVPTTAGNGSDTSQFCIVLDAARKKKIEIFSRKLLPERIFIDPIMTRSMPPDLTASSGMEALGNAIEAYCSTWASPLTDSLALDAIRLISENLRAAVANGHHMEARTNMALAAFEAGLAFTNAQSGAVHALGHSLSGRFDIPERIGDAILLPHVMKANLNADMHRMARVAETMGEPVAGLSVRAAAQQAIEAVKQLLVDVGLPTSLETVGADKNAISAMSEQAFQDTFMRTNPRALRREDIEAIYEEAFVEYNDEDVVPGRGARVTIH
jgi:alcohol dehydrogenase class IV